MKKMTYEDYDALCERLHINPYQCQDWWPTPGELKEKIGSDINQHIDFLIWILETNLPPEIEEEKKSKKYINKLLRENLKLQDPEDKTNIRQ